MDVREHTLSNGLQVWLSPNPAEARIACRVVVRAGAAQDPVDCSGVAHQLEHVMQNKGTRRLERTELKALYGLLGGRSMNAFTSQDRTAYVVDIPSGRLAAWTAAEADRLGEPAFRSFDSEMDVIRSEKRRGLDDPARALREDHSRILWPGHPYSVPILGEVAHLEAPSLSQVREFFARWYGPSNLGVILAGDLDPDAALARIEATFGGLAPRPTPEVPARPPERLAGVVRSEVVHRGPEAVRIGWPTVPPGHPDEDPLQLASMLLSNSMTGLLDVELVQTQKVRSASCAAYSQRLGGSFVVAVSPRPGQDAAEAEELVLAQVGRLCEGEVDGSLLAAIVSNWVAVELRGLEDNVSRAARMTSAFCRGVEWAWSEGRIQALAGIELDRVVAAAARHLGGDRAVSVRRSGDRTQRPIRGPRPGSVEAPMPEAPTPLFQELVALPPAPTVPQVLRAGVDFSEAETSDGRVYTMANPFSDLGSVGLRFYRGSESERGFGTLVALWERAGAGDRDRSAVSSELYRRALRLTTSAGRYNLDLVLSGPSEQLGAGMELLRRRLASPRSPREERAQYLADRVARRVAERTTVAFGKGALGEFARRGPDSAYLRLRLPDAELLSMVDEDLAQRVGGYAARSRTTVRVGPATADLPPGAVDLGLEVCEPEELPPPLRWHRAERDRSLLLAHDSAQATVGVLLPSEPWRREGLAARQLWAEYIGSNTGLVFQEVREKRGLAYSAKAGVQAGWRVGDEDLVWATVGCRPEVAAQVAQLLLQLLRRQPDDVDRFERVRESVTTRVRSDRITFRSVGWTVERWRLRGLPPDPREALRQELETTPLEALRAFARTVAVIPATVWVVGDPTRIDLPALEAVAPTEEVTLDAICV